MMTCMASLCLASGILLACLPAGETAARGKKQPSTVGISRLPQTLSSTYGFLSKSNSDVRDAASSMLGIQGSLDEMNDALHEEYRRWLFKKKNLETERDHVREAIADAQATLEKHRAMQLELQQEEDTYRFKLNDNDKVAATLQEVNLTRTQQKKQMDAEIKDLECQLAAIPTRRQEKLTLEYNLVSKLGDEKAQLQQDILGLNKEVLDQRANASTFAMNSKQEISDLLKDIQSVQSRMNSLEMEVMAQAQGEMEVQRVQHQVEVQINETAKQRQKVLASMAECKTKKSQQDAAIQAAKQSFMAANQKFKECQELDATNQELQVQLTQCSASQRSQR